MEEAGIGLLVVLAEAVVVLGFVVVFLFRYVYKLRRRVAALEGERKSSLPRAVHDFLNRQIETTSAYRVAWMEERENSPSEAKGVASVPIGMDARLAALETELQWVDRDDGRGPESWAEIEQVYGDLVRRLAQVLLSSQEEREKLFEVEDVDVEKLVRECEVALQIVRSRVRNLVVDEEVIAMMMAKLDRISAINRELSYCLVTQMDENRFLCEQVAALVHEG